MGNSQGGRSCTNKFTRDSVMILYGSRRFRFKAQYTQETQSILQKGLLYREFPVSLWDCTCIKLGSMYRKMSCHKNVNVVKWFLSADMCRFTTDAQVLVSVGNCPRCNFVYSRLHNGPEEFSTAVVQQMCYFVGKEMLRDFVSI